MSLYSVFDPDTQRYDYFQGPGPNPGQRVKPPVKGLAGAAPELVMPSLPSGAVRVGSGTDARGVLAVTRFSGFGAAPAPSFVQEHPYLSVAIALGGVMLLYKLVIKAVR